MLKVNKLWGTFVRDACNIENFLVKESGQVSTTVMGTRECPLFGRIADGWEERGAVQGFVASQGGPRTCRQELSWCGEANWVYADV